MNIGYAFDINYVDLFINSIYSIIKNNNCKINFYVITDKQNTIDSINSKINDVLNKNCSIVFAIMESSDVNYYRKNTRNSDELRKDINVIHYGQILFQKYFNVDKILFLEPDQIILKNIKTLFDTNMDNFGIAACPVKNWNPSIIYDHTIIRDRDKYIYNDKIFYFNAGVTLLNFKYWSDNNLFKQFHKIMIKNKNSPEHLYLFYTQGILNILFYNNYKLIDPKYNCVLTEMYLEKKKYKNKIVDDCAILHFNGQTVFNKKIDNDVKDKCLNLYKNYDIINILGEKQTIPIKKENPISPSKQDNTSNTIKQTNPVITNIPINQTIPTDPINLLNQIEVFKNYDLLVISPGGSCQTILMDMIIESNNNISMNLRSDADNLKHLSSYKNSIFNASSFSKILYIHRDPLKVLNSHFNRNWYKMQYKKISNYSDFNKNHLFDDKNTLFKECLKEKKDLTNISQHFYNWCDYNGKIYFLDIDNPDKKSLFKFLEFEIKRFDEIDSNKTKYDDPSDIVLFYKEIDSKIKTKIKEINKLNNYF